MCKMTRCMKHLTDKSSSIGVCASCLRERLVAIKAQERHKSVTFRPKSVKDMVNLRFFRPAQIQKHQRSRTTFSFLKKLFRFKSSSVQNKKRLCNDESGSHQNKKMLCNDESSWDALRPDLTRNLPSFGLCTSPLVRQSSSRQLRVSLEPRLSTNRSRKLSVWGRFNRNRLFL